MNHPDFSSPLLLEEGISAPETYRRIGVFLDTLGALPKKSWRPSVDSRGIRIEGPGLGRMKRLLEVLGEPAAGRSLIHVVGTSGKGSTALMIAQALHAAGRGTAAFFSPHLTTLAERFWIRGRFLEGEAAGRCAARLMVAAAEMASDGEIGPPSYFETTLALLLLAAAEADCEYIVLEAGLGGAYDATNAAGPGALEVITPVGLDHTDLLGDTVGQIARDKAGIITPGGRVISAASHPEARAEIEAAAKERGAGLFSPPGVKRLTHDGAGCAFDVLFDDGLCWEGMRTPMCGAHQAGNAALAAAACRLLDVEEADIRAGIEAARLPGRIEPMPGEPLIVLDGAHNRDKARALTGALSGWPAARRHFVVGTMGNKDYRGLCEELATPGDRFYATLPPGGTPRPGLPPKKLAEALRDAGAGSVETVMDPWRAFERAISEAGEDDLVVVAGSLYLAGELRRRWFSEEAIIESGHSFPGYSFPKERWT
jgi:dihydrofolate synthase/folylpolyglutamate synthase